MLKRESWTEHVLRDSVRRQVGQWRSDYYSLRLEWSSGEFVKLLIFHDTERPQIMIPREAASKLRDMLNEYLTEP